MISRRALEAGVRNEADRDLRRALTHAAQYVDDFVIVDDASDDDTPRVCREAVGDRPLTLIVNEERMFGDEVTLRKKVWEAAIATHPDWLLMLDADEIFEDRAIQELRLLIDQDEADVVVFRLYDFWSETHYREDDHWTAHRRAWPVLVRYRTDFMYRWRETPLHCGRLPENILELPHRASDLRIRHMGWAREADRIAKHQRYMETDPEGRYGDLAQYRSILDLTPRCIPWEE